MRTGLITFHFAHHYGAQLQALATMRAIQSLGHDCEIIDYRLPHTTRTNQLFKKSGGVRGMASDAHTDASVEALPSFAPSSSPSANVPVHAVDDAAQTQSDGSHKSSSDDLFSSMYLSPESKLDFDIPDLSFPTLNTGEFYSGLSGFGKDND